MNPLVYLMLIPRYNQFNDGCVIVGELGTLTTVQLRVTSCPGQADSPLAGRTGWSVTVSTVCALAIVIA